MYEGTGFWGTLLSIGYGGGHDWKSNVTRQGGRRGRRRFVRHPKKDRILR